jgi:HEAT repeat protein
MRVLRTDISRARRTAAAVFALGLCLTVLTPHAPLAQRRAEQGANVTGVSTRPTERGAVVSITGDAPLTRAQTWQDEEGFHVVGYKWAMKSGAPRGIKVRRVGDSLEMIIPVRRGGSVSVHPRFNSLDVVVNGGLDTSAAEGETAGDSPRQRAAKAVQDATQPPPTGERAPRRAARQQADAAGNSSRGGAAEGAGKSERQKQPARRADEAQANAPHRLFASAAATNADGQQQSSVTPAPVEQLQSSFTAGLADEAPAATATPEAALPEKIAPAQAGAAGGAAGSSLLLTATLVVFLLAVLFGFFYFRSRRQDAASAPGAGETKAQATKALVVKASTQLSDNDAADPAKSALARQSPSAETQHPALREAAYAARPAFATPPVLFGALRVEQEVEKLVRGEAHSVEVLASRAPDDRRAVEAALLKAVNSRGNDDGEKARARRALEEYGFVARSAAALLCASDVFDRSSAARVLGAVRSSAALPFLLEALYDNEPVVRAEAVASLGALGLPSAIGALLDLARRHPDIPPQLLGSALSACSVDCVELESERPFLSLAGDDFDGEIAGLEPVEEIEQLPDWLEDETLADALERLSSADVEARVAAAQQLSHFSVARSVKALSAMAADDTDSSVRAAAITSLGHIGHESVFAPVLIAMADEAREVRAAAARALSRLNFDRADAYVRVLETSDDETLRRLSDACITAGLARQALHRLASDDRRQAYEAFSLLSLVARGGGTGLILEAVESHKDLDARVAAARLLALQGDPAATERLRAMGADPRTPERLRAAINEVVTRPAQHTAETADALGE